MTARHALLIGVPRCDDHEFDDIGDVVRADVRAMRQALDQSGYTVVKTYGVEDGEEPTRSRIRKQIERACEAVPEGGVLLLYFSGHGISVDGMDYLVPSDADRDPGAAAPAVEDLVPLLPPLKRCRAGLVAFFVDACRNAPAADHGPASRGGLLPYWEGGQFVMITGCRPGQKCHYGEAGSYFTQALAQTLDRRNAARTLQQVFDDVTRQMTRRAGAADEHPQQPQAHHLAGRMPGADLAICDGDELTVAWRRAVENTPLWELAHVSGAGREAVREVVDRCAVRCNEAAAELMRHARIQDAWSDQNYAIRILDHLPLLLEGAELTPSEVALLVAAPFLRERVIAAGIRQAARIAPDTFERTYTPGPRSDLEVTHEMHQHLLQRAEGLAARGSNEARDALGMWLVHQWLAVGSALWRGEDARQVYAEAAMALNIEPKAPSGERDGLVEALVCAVGADPADHALAERPYLTDRWRALMSLLGLAGTLAVDVRRLSPVIADHLGTQLELPLPSVISAVERLEWQRGEDFLDLCHSCGHPALHLALEGVARAAHDVLTAVSGDARLLKRLPAQITSTGLRPEERGQSAAYATPVKTFRLAEEKIRELLMGRQLYDDPSLAIRELYQNALDACRYRATRLEYRRRTGQACSKWDGLITFRQGAEDGREYIECADNGVGMDADTLLHVFASAGERFVYRQQYRAEQAEWESVDLRMVSNSQFGVGVFSYFMLADEITVLTRPVGRNGIPFQDAYNVHIASSGSLLQITPADGLPDGGTVVRLYLTGDDDVSVLRTLRQLLWVADFDVEAVEEGAGRESWPEGELRYQGSSLKCGKHLWWVSGDGALLADGIVTDQGTFGLVVNLRDVHRPRFTVDRKNLREWDEDWVAAEVVRWLPELVEWPGLTMAWLWEMASYSPARAQQVFDHLVAADVHLPVGGGWPQEVKVALRRVGCMPQDNEILARESLSGLRTEWWRSWRVRQWHDVAPQVVEPLVGPVEHGSMVGFPLVGPEDAKLLKDLRHGSVDTSTLREILFDPAESAESRLKRMRRYAITGLNLSAARNLPLPRRPISAEERPLFAVLRREDGADDVQTTRLAEASHRLTLPLKEVIARAGELAPPGWVPPDAKLGPLSSHVCTELEARLLSRDLDGLDPWLSGDIPLSHIVNASSQLGCPISEVLDTLGRLEPLGVRIGEREHYLDDLDRFEEAALRQVSMLGGRLTPLALALIASKEGLSPREAWERLARLEDAGMIERPDMTGLPDLHLDTEHADALSAHLTLRHFRRGAQALGRQAAAHVVCQRVDGRADLDDRRTARLRSLIPFAQPERPFAKLDLVHLAAVLAMTVGEARERVRTIYPRAEVEAITAEQALLRPQWFVTELIPAPEGAEPRWEAGAWKVASIAYRMSLPLGACLRLLRPYRELGLPLPPLDEDALDDLHPQPSDEVLLTRHDTSISWVGPLDLVQGAGQLGWTVAETHRRLSRYTPLGLTLDYPHDACPETIVHWRDLLALTVHLDGQSPAIAGPVTQDHLAHAADQLDETPAQVHDRLLRYAPLFGLTLPEEPPVAP
ncbi:caspase family protein [Nonomuraea rubra]|uniref:ATP-binding protein n=1 Tax=Nonomuraea rubra TaxID=46180 RepID=A0A7X0NZW1_9ACTN|nr:caspase family protein [Nonomuraea rubra]MBB6552514.1 hypothetical protein [Nonomuraea rubra]